MQRPAYHILRVGVAITFLWIGVLIFKSPEGWGSILQPWAVGLLPVSLESAMIATAILDVLIGFLLLIDKFVWIAAIIAIIHLAIVLTVVGITDITVRDIAILSGLVALFFDSFPKNIFVKQV